MSGRVTIYTDGACRGNPGPGGWGALLEFGDREREIHGAEPATTNNRMELQATIEALKLLSRPCEVVLYTDSTYVRNGITGWMKRWKANNWQTAGRKPVKNRELWEQLDLQATRHRIDWRWVRGHSGNPGNERADQLANTAINEMLA